MASAPILQYVLSRDDIQLMGEFRILFTRPGIRESRQMKQNVSCGARLRQTGGITEPVIHNLYVIGNRGEITGWSVKEMINNSDAGAIPDKFLAQVASDETGATRDDYFLIAPMLVFRHALTL